MKNTNSIKTIIIVILVIILLIWDYNNSKNNIETIYTMELNNEPYTICGKEIYISNDSENNELNVDNIIENVEYLCNFQKIENAKDEIENLLDDDNSYSKNEILQHLQQIYYYYLED